LSPFPSDSSLFRETAPVLVIFLGVFYRPCGIAVLFVFIPPNDGVAVFGIRLLLIFNLDQSVVYAGARTDFHRLIIRPYRPCSPKKMVLIAHESGSSLHRKFARLTARTKLRQVHLGGVCPHEKSSSGSSGSFGVLRCTTGSCRDRFRNPAAFPIPCLDFFRPLRSRIPRQLQPAESGCYYGNSKVTGKHPAAVAESCGPRCPEETA
jgi:hypothetical protein